MARNGIFKIWFHHQTIIWSLRFRAESPSFTSPACLPCTVLTHELPRAAPRSQNATFIWTSSSRSSSSCDVLLVTFPPLRSAPLLAPLVSGGGEGRDLDALQPPSPAAAEQRLTGWRRRRCPKISPHGDQTADLSTPRLLCRGPALFVCTTCVWSRRPPSILFYFFFSNLNLESSTQPTQFRGPETTSRALDRRTKG